MGFKAEKKLLISAVVVVPPCIGIYLTASDAIDGEETQSGGMWCGVRGAWRVFCGEVFRERKRCVCLGLERERNAEMCFEEKR